MTPLIYLLEQCTNTADLLQKLIGKTWEFSSNNAPNRAISFDSTSKSRILEQSPSSSWKIVSVLCSEGISFESTVKPNHFLRHRGFILYADPFENSQQYRNDACFKLIPGLAACDQITFRSVNFPDRYLRHQGYVMKLHQNDGSKLFMKDATFKGEIWDGLKSIYFFQNLR